MKKISMFVGLMLLASCSSSPVTSTQNNSNVQEQNTAKVETSLNANTSNDALVLKVSDKGASIPLSLRFGIQSSFQTKATSSPGVLEKKAADVASVDVYLLSLPSDFNNSTSKDPIGSATSTYHQTISVGPTATKTIANGGFNLLFTGVPSSDTQANFISGNPYKKYWVGIEARDFNGFIISKAVTLRAGTTLANAAGLDLSSTSVGVDENFALLPANATTALQVNVLLLDAVGATVASQATVTDGSPPPVSGIVAR